MAVLVTSTINTGGVLFGVLAAASVGGDKIVANDRAFLVVKNADAAPHTVTLVTPGMVAGLAIADKPVVVAAGATAFIGPFGSVFVDANNQISLTYDAVTAVTVGVFAV